MATLTEFKEAGKQIIALRNRWIKYLKDALGIGPELEPPIVADHPPIHMVDGEPRLGNERRIEK